MDEFDKPRKPYKPHPYNSACHICGSMEFEWGKIEQGVWFSSEGAGMFDRKPLKARECQNCGNVQTFTKRFITNV